MRLGDLHLLGVLVAIERGEQRRQLRADVGVGREPAQRARRLHAQRRNRELLDQHRARSFVVQLGERDRGERVVAVVGEQLVERGHDVGAAGVAERDRRARFLVGDGLRRPHAPRRAP